MTLKTIEHNVGSGHTSSAAVMSLRRGACPSLATPMPTGDGLLIRILPKDRIAPEAFIALCETVRSHGNGIIEISARGSLQVRGLTPHSALPFAAQVEALDIADISRLPVITDPLPGDASALTDTSAVASTLRSQVEACGLTLAPKVSVVIDGGGRLHLDTLSADVRLRAFGPSKSPRLHIALGGDARSATPLGSAALENAADVVTRLLGVIASHGRTARAADILRSEGIAPFHDAAADQIETASALPVRLPVDPVGTHPLYAGKIALGVALAFGQADADKLAQLACLAADHGAYSMRPAPGRVLLLSGIEKNRADALTAEAEKLGLIVRPDDLRRRITACPGKPACRSGWIAARALAAELARHPALRAHRKDMHISGCAKGCAHPAPAALTVVGSEYGCGIVRHGTARATPSRYVDPSNLITEVTHDMTISEAAHV